MTDPDPKRRPAEVQRPVLFVCAVACLALGVIMCGYASVVLALTFGHLRRPDVVGLLGILGFGLAMVALGYATDRRSRRPH